jgi:hypothetical protein
LSSLEYHGEDWDILEEHAKSIIKMLTWSTMEQSILSKRRLGYHRETLIVPVWGILEHPGVY